VAHRRFRGLGGVAQLFGRLAGLVQGQIALLPARSLVDGRQPAPHPPQGATHVAGQLALRRAAGPLGQQRVCQQRVKSDIGRWALIS
jgi:hypothetical protein